MIKQKKQPMRRCVGCREQFLKSTLIRINRSPEGEIHLDPTGRANGRGAYLCRKSECLKKAYRSRALARALDAPVPEEIYDELKKEMDAVETV